MSATAANTVKTVDQRSAGRRTAAGGGRDGSTFAPTGGRSSCSVASSARVCFSSTRDETARAVPNGRRLDPVAARATSGYAPRKAAICAWRNASPTIVAIAMSTMPITNPN
jgi:hypothetical protein